MSIEKEIWKTITNAGCILITSHERVDGDGVGSELALMHLMREAGPKSVIINDGVVPAVYRFLPGSEDVHTMPDGWRDDFDLVISLDSATAERLRKVNDKLPKGIKVINIDHHVSNTKYGDINWLEVEVSSVGEMIFNFAKANDLTITPDVATCLYTAIITDTGRFCHSNALPQTHLVIAELIRCGASPSEISRHIYREERLEVLHLRRLAMATLGFSTDRKIAWMDVTADMHRQSHTDYLDTQDFVDIPKSIKGVEASLLFREVAEDDKIRVSMRSEGMVDVNAVAQQFGGGGHRRAAGCTVEGSIEHARELVLPVVEKMLSRSPS